MNDFSGFRPTNKEVAFGVLAVFVMLVAVGTIGYLLGWERAEDVYCNGSGTESVGQQLNEAGTNISNAKEGIESAQGHIATSTESVDYLQGTVSTSAELIADCKRIIETIRKRGETDKTTH